MTKTISSYQSNMKIFLLILFIIIISIFTVKLAIQNNVAQALQVLQQAIITNPLWIFYILIWFIFFLFGGSFSYYFLVGFFKKDYRIIQAIKLFLIGVFFSSITPFASGGQIIQFFVLHKQGLKRREALSVLLMEFMIYQLVFTLMSLIFFIWKFNFLEQLNLGLLMKFGFLGWGTNLVVTLLLFFVAFSNTFHKLMVKLLFNPLQKLHFKSRLISKIEILHEKMDEFRSRIHEAIFSKKIWLITAFSCFIWIFSISIMSYLSAKFLAPTIKFTNFFDIIASSLFVTSMNTFVPLPGGTGTTEISFILIFQSIFKFWKVANSPGEIAALSVTTVSLWRIITFHVPLWLGFIIYLWSRDGIRQYAKKEKE